MKRGLLSFFVITILLINFISSATVVETNPAQPEEKKGFFDFLKSPIFWWALVGVVLFGLFMLCIFLLVKWIIKYFKSQNDIFYTIRKERMYLSKVHSRYPSKHWFKIEKNTPIRLIKTEGGKVNVSQPIAYHRGDYTTHEGNLIISMNMLYDKVAMFFPRRSLLVVPNKEKIQVTRKDKNGKTEIIEVDGVPRADQIVQFNQDEILIHAESISQAGLFHVPVLRSQDGKIIDLSLPVYQSLREVAMGEYLYQQSSDFVNLSKKAVDMNPRVISEVKLSDSNQSTNVSQQNPQ